MGVVEAMLAALGRGDVATCYNFASPNSNVGRQKFDLIVRHSPAYAPGLLYTACERPYQMDFYQTSCKDL